jgi:hypothetical protein
MRRLVEGPVLDHLSVAKIWRMVLNKQMNSKNNNNNNNKATYRYRQ